MIDDWPAFPSSRRGRGGLVVVMVSAGGIIGALAGRALRGWRSSSLHEATRWSSTGAEQLLGDGMAKKKQASDSAAIYIRLDHATLERLDAFAATQDGTSSRAEAARMLIAKGLDGGSPLPEPDEPRFKPGDRVATNRHGAGVITEGPIHSTHYAVTFDDGADAPPRVNERGLRPA